MSLKQYIAPTVKFERELRGQNVILEELNRWELANVQFSGGLVKGDPHEHVYLRIEDESEEEIIYYLERHEALAVLWVLSGAVAHSEIERTEEED